MKLKLFRKKFPFADAPNTMCFTCCHVLTEHKPILYVSHDDDGYWQFLCGQKHTTEEARIVSLPLILKIDKEIGNLANLYPGEYAEKDTKADCWIVGQKGN